MPTTRRPARDLNAARTIFNTAPVSVGGLYLTTHSVAVTLIGTAAATALTGWTLWLPYKRNRALGNRDNAATLVQGQTAVTVSENEASASAGLCACAAENQRRSYSHLPRPLLYRPLVPPH